MPDAIRRVCCPPLLRSECPLTVLSADGARPRCLNLIWCEILAWIFLFRCVVAWAVQVNVGIGDVRDHAVGMGDLREAAERGEAKGFWAAVPVELPDRQVSHRQRLGVHPGSEENPIEGLVERFGVPCHGGTGE